MSQASVDVGGPAPYRIDIGTGLLQDAAALAAHWRGQWGPLLAFARLSAAHIGFDGTRRFDNGDVTRTANGNWKGKLYSATAGASYQWQMGRISLRPAIGIDYYRLKEDGYSESGGGDAFNLTVLGRTSDETTASGMVFASASSPVKL